MSKKYPGGFVTNLGTVGYSVFFDGTGDYLSVADNAALEFGNSDFTIEAWFYFAGTPNSNNGIVQKGGTGTSNLEYFLNVRPSSNTIEFSFSTNGTTLTTRTSSSVTILQNAWYHVAVARTSATLYFFLNGVSAGTAALSSTLYSGNADLGIGASGTGSNIFAAGYISNVRVVKGTALYTAAFTPPTQLLNVTNTSLLTCNSPTIVDQSSNNFAITVNGNAAVSTFTPFPVYNAYNPALGASTPGVWTLDQALQAAATRQWNMYDPYFNLTTLYLPGNGTNGAQNNTFLDSSTNNFTITRNGNTTQGTFSPFSQTGWSNYFDGSGDYLSVTRTQTMGGDFTIEAWYYPVVSQAGALFTLGNYTQATGLELYFSSSNVPTLYSSGGAQITGSAFPLNAWTYFAVVRSGTTIRLYINGIAVGTTYTSSASFSTVTYIGVEAGASPSPSIVAYGYISNFRIVDGTAVYTSNFTPPTAPLAAITNTVLLTCQSNRFRDASTNNFTLTVNGTPSIQAFSPVAPTTAYSALTVGGSGYFDGTTDYLSIANNAALTPSGDFTIEFWGYPLTIAGTQEWYSKGYGIQLYISSSSWGAALSANNSTTYFFNQLGPAVPNVWTHIALTRNGNDYRFFINGVLTGTLVTSSSAPSTGTDVLRLGDWSLTTSYPITGYMSSVRYINGTALYTSNFTPPTSPPTAITNTQLLCNFTNAAITDATAKTVLETIGTAQISTTQSKFGGSSMYFAGGADYLRTLATPVNFGTSDFTIEYWTYFTASGQAEIMIDTAASSYGGVLNIRCDYIDSARSVYVDVGGISFTGTYTAATPLTNNWRHWALVRSGTGTNNVTLYLDGVAIGQGTTSASISIPTNTLNIGGATAPTSGYSNVTGYMDDIRITRFARYKGNFTPPTSGLQQQ